MPDKTFTVFVVEDNDWYNKFLVHTISLNPDYTVSSFETGKAMLAQLHKKPAVITLDYKLPDMTGEEVLAQIKQQSPDTEVIIISEQENIETAVDLLKNGAYDYIVKAKDIRDRLLHCIQNIRKNTTLKKRIDTLEQEVLKKYDFSKTLIGTSEKMQRIHALIEKAISTNITAVITGETGTGKEVVAKCIHYNSTRKNKPFVAVNIAAIPSTLMESELFGYEKGAFTGANARRIGKFEEANGGTLFLDEIGDLDLSLQVKLLRALQEKEVVRIGSNQPVKTECRIIVATHKNLQEEVKSGRFREDLYYRLFGLTIELPPLRERGHDIIVLAKHFIVSFCKENNLEQKTLTETAQLKLMSYSFPGNVRELKSIVELAVVMSNDNQITEADITLTSFDALPDVVASDLTLKEYEYRIVMAYLNRYQNNIKTVAERLDISQSTIYRMLKKDTE